MPKIGELLILVSNDDGVHSEGIQALREAMRPLGRVITVAPDRERSASSHSLTLHRPVRAKRIAEDIFSVDGTPTDCVNLAINRLLPRRPDFVVSGINHGANLGDDIGYSGTVSAAIEGTLLRVPSIAVSALDNDQDQYSFDAAGAAAMRLIHKINEHPMPEDTLLNVNVPPNVTPETFEFDFVKQGKRIYSGIVDEKVDPRGRIYYWMGGEHVKSQLTEATDCHSVDVLGKVSVTPIQLDMTDYKYLVEMDKWKL